MRECRGRVHQRTFVGVQFEVQVSAEIVARTGEQVLANDDDRHARRAKILLGTGVNHAVPVHIGIGLCMKSLDASHTSGTLPTLGSVGNCTPSMVSLQV